MQPHVQRCFVSLSPLCVCVSVCVLAMEIDECQICVDRHCGQTAGCVVIKFKEKVVGQKDDNERMPALFLRSLCAVGSTDVFCFTHHQLCKCQV